MPLPCLIHERGLFVNKAPWPEDFGQCRRQNLSGRRGSPDNPPGGELSALRADYSRYFANNPGYIGRRKADADEQEPVS
jgi:hypothetical protein